MISSKYKKRKKKKYEIELDFSIKRIECKIAVRKAYNKYQYGYSIHFGLPYLVASSVRWNFQRYTSKTLCANQGMRTVLGKFHGLREQLIKAGKSPDELDTLIYAIGKTLANNQLPKV